MLVSIRMPELGAGPVMLSVWYASIGDDVFEGERLIEVLAQSATFDLSAPASGRLTHQAALVNDRLHVGQILGTIEVPD